MTMVLQPQLISMILRKFKDQYGKSWSSRLLWIFRRVLFILKSWFFDMYYISIDVDKLLDALADWRNNILEQLPYLPEVFDCDDFAVYFKVWLQKWVRENTGDNINCVGIALGQLYKDGRLLGGHAWNIVLVDSGGRAYILFVEPQLGEIIPEDNISSDGYEYVLQAVII